MIAYVKNNHVSKAHSVRAETFKALGRIGARRQRDISLCPAGIPNVDDKFDMTSYNQWIKDIDPKDKLAVDQLLAIDAACNWRIKG